MDSALLSVFKYLSPGMLLRVGAVCKLWYDAANDDELWILILAREAKCIPGYNKLESLHMNIRIFRNLVNKKERKKSYYAKKLYLSRRKKEFKFMELAKPGSTKKFKVF